MQATTTTITPPNVRRNHLDPDTVIAGTSHAVGTYDAAERRRAELKGLRVTRRENGDSYRFKRSRGRGRHREVLDVQEKVLAKALWGAGMKTRGAGVRWNDFRAAVRAAS